MFGVIIVFEFIDRIEIIIIVNNFKEGVDLNIDFFIRMDSVKLVEFLKEIERKKELEEEIDILFWMRNNKR